MVFENKLTSLTTTQQDPGNPKPLNPKPLKH